MKTSAFAFSFAILAASAFPALAQSVGMAVVDTQGGVVGTVTAIKGENILVKTDRHEAQLPKSSMTLSDGKLLIGMTQAQLNAEIEKSQTQAQAALAPGATVKGSAGTVLGTIESIEGANAVVKLASGSTVAIPVAGMRGNADGTVVVGLTAEQLEQSIKGSGGTTEGQ